MPPTSPQTQAAEFAAQYAKDAGPEMLATVKNVGKKAGTVTGIALGVSMPHQIGYLIGLSPMAWHTPQQILGSLTGITSAIGVPVAVDFMIMTCVQVIAAKAATSFARKLALALILVPVLVSSTVNVIAPDPTILRALYGAIVLFIPMAEALKAALKKPDFKQLDQAETAIAAEVAKPAVAGRKCPAGCTCGKHTPKAKKPAVRKAAAPRTRKAPVKTQTSIADVIASLPDAPVSPAANTLRTSSGLLIAHTMDQATA